MSTLGWIGLGNIGMPMALRLLRAGHSVHVWGRSAAPVAAIVAQGARAAASPVALARDCDAVFLCVTDDAAVEAVVFGADGMAGAGAAVAGRLLIDHSTIHPERCRALAARLRAATGMRWLDAPVSGGPKGAEQGTLAIMIGGEADAVEAARPWLSAYAGKITHVGASGAGLIAKSCNQSVVAAAIAAWAETVNYAERCGIDVARAVEAMEGGWADSLIRQQLVPQMLRDQYTPGAASILLKDLEIIADLARKAGAEMPLNARVAGLLREQIAAGDNAAGPAGLVRLYRRKPAG
jgi:3-hydroxyisobutyrate dehydrogenase-like beta-hydroxyacid dehydrogenase